MFVFFFQLSSFTPEVSVEFRSQRFAPQPRHVEGHLKFCRCVRAHPMTEDSDPKCYLFPALDRHQRRREGVALRAEEEQHSPRSAIRQLRRMASSYSQDCGGQDGVELDPELGLVSEGSDISHEHPASPGSPHQDRKRTHSPLHEDVEMGGSGSSGSGTESHGNDSHGNDSHGNESVGSSNGNGKDSALLESSGSNKR